MQDQNTINNNRSELWTLSFKDLIFKYIRFLPIIILSAAVSLFGAYAYLRYATSIYSVSGTIYIKSEGQNGRSSNKFQDIFVNDKAQNIQSEIEVLKSKPLMERVVQRLGLQFTYFIKGKVKTINIYKSCPFYLRALKITDSSQSFSLKIKFKDNNSFTVNNEVKLFHFGDTFEKGNGVFTLLQKNSSVVAGEYLITWTPTYQMAGALVGDLQIMPKSLGTGILIISQQSTNPQLSADVVNQLMDEYRIYNVEEKQASSDSILRFIDDQLAVYDKALDSAQRDLLNYQQEHGLIDMGKQSGSYLQSVEESDNALGEQRLKIGVAEMIENYLKDQKNEFSKVVVPSSLGLEDITLNELIGGYNKSQLERQRLLDANVTPDNPAMTELNGQIEKLRRSILENLKNIKATYNTVINNLSTKQQKAISAVKAAPFISAVLAEKQRKVEGLQELYKFLQEQKAETSISKASTTSNSKVVDKAFGSNTPVKPNRRAIQILAILLGLAIPVLIIFIGEILNDKVTTRFDIEKVTTTPILGEIGHSYSNNTLIVTKTTRSMVAEQFRIIRSNLQYILNKSEKSVILVTSSFSGEGKSFVSTNIAAVMALAGKKTIIFEFDIRKPKVLSGLGMPKGSGITNFLVGKAQLDDLVRPVPGQENLFVLGCGPIPPNPAELLLDNRVEELFSWARKNYDMVVIDTAPVGMVSDAMTLGKFADCTLYMVRQGHTFKKQVVLIDEFYVENKIPKVSIIINDVKMKQGYGYYGYGRYGYGYGYDYGSYYEEEQAPKSFFEKVLHFIDLTRFFKKKK